MGRRLDWWFVFEKQFPRLYQIAKNQQSLIQSAVIWNPQFGYVWDLQFRRNFNDREVAEFSDLMQRLESRQLNILASNKRVWIGNSSRVFSCKSLLENLSVWKLEPNFPHFNFTWKSGIPTKIKVFSWFAILGKINTADFIQKKRPHCALSPSFIAALSIFKCNLGRGV